MTNFEYYFEIVKRFGLDFAIVNGEFKSCEKVSCKRCVFFRAMCREQKREFLMEEHTENPPIIEKSIRRHQL